MIHIRNKESYALGNGNDLWAFASLRYVRRVCGNVSVFLESLLNLILSPESVGVAEKLNGVWK